MHLFGTSILVTCVTFVAQASGPQMRGAIRPVEPPGIDGHNGDRGNPGPKGPTAPKGMSEMQGPQGLKGPRGYKG
ncbi:unnamed protein product [Cercopithifilaria johnstoni]|uniref:Uncharacterized protein n=1 Tax=Cercopithifilaria johnstoni TaxID=2874296 RepID=A0A8J2Q9L1_9BILA|nr:unnamed protein product [Cercopithifilaria johnstoni]